MKPFVPLYVRLAIAIVLAACAQCTYADSIPTFYITQATMFMGPNDGSGDNVSFVFTGPGVNIAGVGGMACFDWCSGPISDPSFASTSQIFLTGFGVAIFNGKSYDPSTLGFESLFSNDGGLNHITGGSVGGDTFLQFNLILPTTGGWTLNFDPTTDQNGNPAFIFTEGSFFAQASTPEPGTIALMLTGLAGIVGMKRKAKFRH